MQRDLWARSVDVCKSTCRIHVKKALGNNCVVVSPQKPGGLALPSYLEKKIANCVRALRQRKFHVFPEEVLRWAAEAIEGTEYAAYFKGGKPTTGWYKGWLKRMELTT
jgi:hypothetical protein